MKKRKTTRAVAKRGAKRSAKKMTGRKAKRTVTARGKAIARATKKAKEKLIGKVVHYYDKIGVAIIDLDSPLKVGDTVKMMRGEEETTQRVNSMQIDHTAVPQAKKGDVIGLKVDQEVREGTKVVPA